MENSQQPQTPFVQENTVSHSNKNLSLPLIVSGLVMVTALVSGGIGYYMGLMQTSQKPLMENTIIQVSPQVENLSDISEVPVTVSPSQVNLSEVCNELTKTWITANVAEAMTVKIPSYFKQESSSGGQYFTIDHPTYKNFNLNTTLIGDYAPQGKVSVEEKLQSLLDMDTSFGVPIYSFNKDRNYRYVIGDRGAIVVREKEPAQWWMFSIVPQEDNSAELGSYLNSNEMKCILDTVEFTN